MKNDNAPGQGPAAKLKGDRPVGQLAKGVTTGSGGSFGGSMGGGSGPLLANAKGGRLGGMSTASRAAAGDAKALTSGRRLGSAFNQLGSVNRDQRGAQSSMAAGRTYDGNSQPSSVTGQPTDASGAGTDGNASQNPSVNPGGSGDSQRWPSTVAPVTGTNVTPWQAAINTSLLLVAGAAVLLLLASKVTQMTSISFGMAKAIAIALASLALMLSLGIIALGGMIGSGQYGQHLQGELLAMAGGCLALTATIAIVSLMGTSESSAVKAGDEAPDNTAKGMTDGAGGYNQAGADQANATASQGALAGAMGGSTGLLMMCCGGAALAATAWAYMSPAKSYSGGLFKDGRAPDWDHKYQPATSQVMPSEKILDRYLV